MSGSPSAEKREFIEALLKSDLGRVEQFVALLWYEADGSVGYEANADQLIDELEAAGLAQQNRARLKRQIATCPDIVKGRSAGALRLSARSLHTLDTKYKVLLAQPKPVAFEITDEYLPSALISPARPYWLKITAQINGCYHCEYYDAVLVLLRRLIESLLLELYIVAGRQAEVRSATGGFFMLDRLIGYFHSDHTIVKSRELVKTLERIKELGDNAAHSRHYISLKADADEVKLSGRRAVSELLTLITQQP